MKQNSHGWVLVWGLLALFAVGCGGGGGGGDGAVTLPATNTTIAGQVTVPSVTATGIVSSIAETNDAALLEKLATGGTCTVNGQSYAFSLATATRYYQVTDVPPAGSYDVRLKYQNLELRTTFAGGSSFNYSKNINIDSTVKAWIIEKYAFTPAQMSSWEIDQTYVDGLAQKFQTWLQTPTIDFTKFQSDWAGELASLTANVPVGSLTSDLTPAVDLTGKWKGTNCIFYNLNLYGERAYKVTADVTMDLKQNGRSVTGVMDIYPRSQERLPGIDLGVPEPEHHSSIDGTISSTRFSFTVGKGEKWEFQCLSRSMRGKVSNLDLNYFLGVESEEGAFLLIME
ncbi:MAG: hypothetical protein GX442_22455 [Candidatus Riflebacteria bacterium]|nr:hypothetical protein [Candidatus Riflebacteria bacterium]